MRTVDRIDTSLQDHANQRVVSTSPIGDILFLRFGDDNKCLPASIRRFTITLIMHS